MKPVIFLIFTIFISSCAANSGGSGGSGGSSTLNPGNTTTTFQDPTNLQISANSTSGTPRQLVIGDFNGDSYPDIVLLTDSGALLYINKAGSAWASPVDLSATLSQPYKVGTSDGADIITYRHGSYLSLLTNSGAGTFTETSLTTTPTLFPISVAYAPSKSTSKHGFIFAAAGATGSHFTTLRSGTTLGPSMTTINSSILAGNSVKVLAGDIDSDSYVDFALIPSSAGGVVVELYKNNADNSIDSSPTGTIARNGNSTVRDAVLADLNGDSKLDLLLATTSGLEFYQGDSKFTGFTFSSSFSPQSFSVPPTSLVAVDVTGDAGVDLFMSTSGATSALYTKTGDQSFSDITSTAFGSLLTKNTIAVYTADIDQNGYPDLVELKSDKTIAVHINNLKKP